MKRGESTKIHQMGFSSNLEVRALFLQTGPFSFKPRGQHPAIQSQLI